MFLYFKILYKLIVQIEWGRIFWVLGICDEVYRFGLQFLLFEKVITILRYAEERNSDLDTNYLHNPWVIFILFF